MGAQKIMPTEAKIARFVRAISRSNPELTRIRITPEGDMIAEKGDTPLDAPESSYDALAFRK